MTGFVLIQLLGSRQTLLLVAAALLVQAASVGIPWRNRAVSFGGTAMLLGLLGLGLTGDGFDSECDRESGDYCIRVADAVIEDGSQVKAMYLDHLLHSYVSVNDPTRLVYGYQRVLGDLGAFIVQDDAAGRVLFVGGGGYTMPRYLEATYPELRLEVIEIDPEVTEVVYDELGLSRDTGIVTRNADARMVVGDLPAAGYSLIVGDAFHDVAIPYHLTTREFNEGIATLLTPDGIYFVNVIDRLQTGKFLRAYVTTLQLTFPHVYLVRDEARWLADTQETYGMVATLKPLTPGDLARVNEAVNRPPPVARFMPEEAFTEWLGREGTIVLTDDHAPVENLMAGVYVAGDDLTKAERLFNDGLELRAAGRLAEAVEKISAGIAIAPNLDLAFTTRGHIFNELGEYELAIDDLSEAVRLTGGSARSLVDRGTAYAVQGQLDLA